METGRRATVRRALDPLPNRLQRAGAGEVRRREERRVRNGDACDPFVLERVLCGRFEQIVPDHVARKQALRLQREQLGRLVAALVVEGLPERSLEPGEAARTELERLDHGSLLVAQLSRRDEVLGAGDDLSLPINWRAGARYGELNYRIARALADADQRPLWYRDDYFADRFAPGQPRTDRRP